MFSLGGIGEAVAGFDVEQLKGILKQNTRRLSSAEQSNRQRSNRIVKPSSVGNSPRNPSSRRSTYTSTHGYPFSAVRMGHHPAMSPSYQSSNEVEHRTRPISWHPSSFQMGQASLSSTPYAPYFQSSTSVESLPQESFVTKEVHGLITPLAQPCSDEPFAMDGLSNLEEDPYAYLDEFRGPSTPDWPSYGSPNDVNMPPIYAQPESISSSQSSVPSNQPRTVTAPPSPYFSMSHDSSQSNTQSHTASKIESATEELIGMGLYDLPSAGTGSLLGRGFGPRSSGKGLKLEETFEPSNQDDDEETNHEDDDDDLITDNEDTLTPYESENSASTAHNLIDRSFF